MEQRNGTDLTAREAAVAAREAAVVAREVAVLAREVAVVGQEARLVQQRATSLAASLPAQAGPNASRTLEHPPLQAVMQHEFIGAAAATPLVGRAAGARARTARANLCR